MSLGAVTQIFSESLIMPTKDGISVRETVTLWQVTIEAKTDLVECTPEVNSICKIRSDCAADGQMKETLHFNEVQ
jgi:hypothetical protein